MRRAVCASSAIDVGENGGKAPAVSRSDFNVPYALAVDPDRTTRASYGGGLFFRSTCSSTRKASCACFTRAR